MPRPSLPCALATVLVASAWGCSPGAVGTVGGTEPPAVEPPDGTDGADGTDGSDPAAVGGALFDTNRVIEVELELAEADWAALRRQTRSMFDVLGGDCMAGPAESPYTWFRGTATVDGERLEDVAIRKKGFIGSLSIDRPGLKLDFDKYVDDRLHLGLERMTLNNMRQDGTLIRTCLAYEHFANAGVPAPRCSFVNLTVNGETLGIYSHVETMNDRFVERVTGQQDVPLFEGTLSDLRAGWTDTYDLDSDAADLSQLEPLVEAIDSGDLDTIASVFDLDAFLRFSAAEVMTGHWDGYGWNTNNYYLYIDPADGLARFLPWGPDAAWSARNPGGGQDWIAANSALPRAVFTTEQGLSLYRDEAQRQVESVWSESAMLQRAGEMLDLIAPHFRPSADERGWLEGRLESQSRLMTAGLTGGPPSLSGPLRPELCLTERGSLDVTFDSTYGSLEGSRPAGTCSLSLTWDEVAYDAVSGTHYTGTQYGRAANACIVPWGAGDLLVYLEQPLEEHVTGAHQTEHTVSTGTLYYQDASTGGNWTSLSWLEGTLVLDTAAPTVGAEASGSYTATVWDAAW